jgi:hypothetical protein
MRSGRLARIALTAATVTTASPTPITAWTASIAGSTVPSGTVPDAASSSEHAAAPAMTASQAAMPTVPRNAARVRGRSLRPTASTSPAPSPPTTPMLRMLAPSAVTPPSAKTKACMTSTDGQDEARGPGAEQHGGERRAEEVPAGPTGDGEVQHLGSEHERARDAEQRDARSSRVRSARRRA